MNKTFYSILFFVIFTNSIFAQDYNALKAEANSYWIMRDKTESLQKAIDAYTQSLSLAKDNHEKNFLQCRLSHAYYILGDSMTEPDKRQSAFFEGAKKAYSVLQIYDKDPEANFFYVINQLSYLNETSFLRAYIFVPEAYRRINIIMDQDKYLFYGGPQRIKSRMIHFAPRYMRNRFAVGTLYDAEKMLKEAIKTEQNFALNRLFLAEIYLDMNNLTDAKKELIQVLNSPVNNERSYAAENRIYKQRGKILLHKHFSEYNK
jgi:tetratricopeptide (TPR) repeat protein